MRQWINIAAILLESSDVLYHGTTERLWKSSGKNVNFNLYLTDDLSEARKYAEDAVKSKRDKPIVVVFKMSDLRSLPVEFEPDWGWIDALENDLKNQGKTLDQLPTWQQSLSTVGSLCVSGFTDAMKRIGKAEIVEAAMLGEASSKSKLKILQNHSADLWQMMVRKFGNPLEGGRYRAVWGNDRYVFKLPANLHGWDDNIREYESFHGWDDNIREYESFRANKTKPLAKCRLLYILGIPVLVMERVSAMNWKDQPDWAANVDQRQVGLTRSGKPVAFDYARLGDVDAIPAG